MKLAIVLTASILAFTTLDARGAAPADDVYSATVQFDDLDLSRKAGVAKLYFRIRAAAKRVCGEQANERLVAKQTYDVCVKRAVSAAVARIDRPMLTDYYAQLGGKPAKAEPESVAAR
jgi:UrcA family protein